MNSYNQPAVEEGKIFIGGLSWDTTKESLQTYFSQFGTVVKSEVMYDEQTKKPRGFGFITFEDSSIVEGVLSRKPHVVDNKTVDAKIATVKGHQAPQQVGGMANAGGASNSSGKGGQGNKIFIGGVGAATKEEDIKDHFVSLGHAVTSVVLKYDSESGRMRGFGFVEFERPESVGAVVAKKFHEISGKMVEAKRAEDREPGKGKRGQPQGQQLPADYGQGAYAAAGGNYGAQHGYNFSTPYDYGAYAAAYGMYNQYLASQQASTAGAQQIRGQGYGQDGRSGAGYGAASTGYQQFGGQGPASGYDQSQGNHVAGMAAYQQQGSYNPNSQAAAATYNQSTGGQQAQYYQ